VLGKLAAHHGVEIDHVDGNVLPAELLGGAESTFACDERAIRPDNDVLKQPKLGDAGGEPVNVAHIAPVARADGNGVDRERWGRGGGGHCSAPLRFWPRCATHPLSLPETTGLCSLLAKRAPLSRREGRLLFVACTFPGTGDPCRKNLQS